MGIGAGRAALHITAVFLGAFLLFQIQPLTGKYILPWFGGGAEVWTTCMLFFQVMLLGGYAYAHLSVSRLSSRIQALIHIALVGAAVLLLPGTPWSQWRPEHLEHPIFQILVVIAGCVGLPYFVLSSTGPLIQAWASRLTKGRSVYRLYAFSNAGSLIGLLSYPFIVEPLLSRDWQVRVWSAGLVLFGVISVWCAVLRWTGGLSEGPGVVAEKEDVGCGGAGFGTRLLWFGLAGVASVELLAVTNKICQDIMVVPFLWVLPLSLYLLSFVVCFAGEKYYVRGVFLGAYILAIGGVGFACVYQEHLSVWQQILIYCVFLFSCCMVCHGELFALRPGRRQLTGYYLMIACGGAAGGFFVAVICPLIFTTYRELYVGILLCCIIVLCCANLAGLSRRRRIIWGVVLAAVGACAVFFSGPVSYGDKRVAATCRNFFGVLTVWEERSGDVVWDRYVLQHGSTFHGLQYVNRAKRSAPTAYYGRQSGIGLAMGHFRREGPRRIGVVGLGVGTLATYTRRGDYIRFYEINPAVKDFAEEYFTYLADCNGQVDVVIGDGRLSLEDERRQGFDLLVLDAFASDSVPVHLLTKEAFVIYLRHLKPDGVLALHVSSRALDLRGVVLKAAEYFRLKSVWIESPADAAEGLFVADWILLTKNEEFMNLKAIRQAGLDAEVDLARTALWTDDYVNLLQVVR